MAKISTDATATFFEQLAARGHEPLLQSASGTLRFELKNGGRTQYWFVTIDKGDITVSHANAEADAVRPHRRRRSSTGSSRGGSTRWRRRCAAS